MTQETIELKRVALTGGIWSLASTGITALLTLGSSLVLAQILSPADFGAFAITMVILNLSSTFTGLNIGAALVQRQQLTKEEISSAFWLYFFTSLIIFALIAALSPLFSYLFNEPALRTLLPLSATSCVIGSVAHLYLWLLEKELDFTLLAKQDIFVALISRAVTIGLAYQGQGAWSLVWGYLAESVLASFLLVWIGWKRWKPLLHFQWSDIQKFLTFGIYQMGEDILLSLSSRLDQILVGWLLGISALGVYEFVTMRLVNPLGAVTQTLLRNAFPLFARVQHDKTVLRQSFITLTKVFNNIDAPLLYGIGAFAPILIHLFFGQEWLPAAPLVPFLAAAQMFRRVNFQAGTLMLATGKPEASFRWNLLLVFASSVAIIPGALCCGISGVAVAVLLTTTLGAFFGYFILIKPLLGECGKVLALATLKPVTLSIICSLLVELVVSFGNQTISWLLITCSIGLALYVAVLWLSERKPALNES